MPNTAIRLVAWLAALPGGSAASSMLGSKWSLRTRERLEKDASGILDFRLTTSAVDIIAEVKVDRTVDPQQVGKYLATLKNNKRLTSRLVLITGSRPSVERSRGTARSVSTANAPSPPPRARDARQRGRQRVEPGPRLADEAGTRMTRRRARRSPQPSTARSTAGSSGSQGTTAPAWSSAVCGSLSPCRSARSDPLGRRRRRTAAARPPRPPRPARRRRPRARRAGGRRRGSRRR